MPARTQKKFRIEIQREEYLAQRNKKRANGSNGTANGSSDEMLAELQALRSDLQTYGCGAALGPDTERIIQEKVALENELRSLSKALDDTKREIAGLRYSSIHGDRISSMNNQLDAIIEASEDATNRILSSAETIEEGLQHVQTNATEEDEISALEALGDEVIKIFEACNFQDLTGQRITKVIETLKYVEERVDNMISMLGDDSAFVNLVEPEEVEDVGMHGPQREGEGISQSEIDSLFD